MLLRCFRLAHSLSTLTCCILVAQRVWYPNVVARPGLSNDLSTATVLDTPIFLAWVAWAGLALAGIVVYLVHRRRVAPGKALWLPSRKTRQTLGIGDSKSWTGSFRVVSDWDGMEDSWSGTILGGSKEKPGLTTSSELKSTPEGDGITVPHQVNIKRAAAFHNRQDLEQHKVCVHCAGAV